MQRGSEGLWGWPPGIGLTQILQIVECRVVSPCFCFFCLIILFPLVGLKHWSLCSSTSRVWESVICSINVAEQQHSKFERGLTVFFLFALWVSHTLTEMYLS